MTGVVYKEKVNADEAVNFGTKQRKEFEMGWSDSFQKKFPCQVTTAAVTTMKQLKQVPAKHIDTSHIFAKAEFSNGSVHVCERGVEVWSGPNPF